MERRDRVSDADDLANLFCIRTTLLNVIQQDQLMYEDTRLPVGGIRIEARYVIELLIWMS